MKVLGQNASYIDNLVHIYSNRDGSGHIFAIRVIKKHLFSGLGLSITMYAIIYEQNSSMYRKNSLL